MKTTIKRIMAVIAVMSVLALPNITFSEEPKWVVFDQHNSGLPGEYPHDIEITDNNVKWIATASAIARFDNVNWESWYGSVENQTRLSSITDIAVDGNGVVWVGVPTMSGGLFKFNGENWTKYTTKNSDLPDKNVKCITIEGDVLWIGTLYSGLVRFDGENWEIFNMENSGIPSNSVLAITIDGEGNKWLGTKLGLAKFDGQSWETHTTSNSDIPEGWVRAVAIGSDGAKWIGTDRSGLAKFDGENWTVYDTTNSNIPTNDISCITVENDILWIGSFKEHRFIGLLRFDGEIFVEYNIESTGTPLYFIKKCVIDDYGNKWIACHNAVIVHNENGVILTDVPGVPAVGGADLLYYPNPLDVSFTVKYTLPGAARVELAVYDMNGVEVRALENGLRVEGEHSAVFDAAGLPAGAYFLRLTAAGETRSAKIIVK